MKRCGRCKQEKPITDFHKDKNRLDGYQNQCKICKNAILKNWRSPHRVDNQQICKNMEKLHMMMDKIIRTSIKEMR